MGKPNSQKLDGLNTPRVCRETKKSRLAVRRLLHESSYPEARRIAKILDDSNLILGRGRLYIPRYFRLTMIETEELPLGKKHRTTEILSRVPSCTSKIGAKLGGFIVARISGDIPELALEIKSKKIDDEMVVLRNEFSLKDLELRGNAVDAPIKLCLAVASLDRDQSVEDYFNTERLMEMNELAGATISDAGVYMGCVVLNAVTPPTN